MFSWMFNPLMLGIGAIAMASPIIIHLLNKRKFRVIDWAAMDFLFDADKKNRRRIRLENFILLLLRCLAMLILGLLLARPFLPSQLAQVLGQAQEFQRILIVDDSLSQQTSVGNQTAFDSTKDRIKQLLQMVAHDGNNYLTLYLTSRGDKPVMVNEAINGDTLETLIQRIDELKCSDKSADYQKTLTHVRDFSFDNRSKMNRVIYVLTDMREKDWDDPSQANQENSPRELMAEINKEIPNLFVVDVGSTQEENLVVSDIEAEDLLVSNTVVRFRISVTNYGKQTANDVSVRFRVDDLQPQSDTIAEIGPGQTETVTFRFMFQSDNQEFSEMDFQDRLAANRMNFRITAEIVQDGSVVDQLTQDSEGFFAARVLRGLPILIVDGDPSAVPERSESYYLRSLEVPGTGVLVDTTTASEFETVSLSKYRVIFLCNIDEASPERIQALSQWVEDGGGLVFLPGDRVRASTFNEAFYGDGDGLSPVRLDGVDGDPSKSTWTFFEIDEPGHPALRVTLDDEIDMSKVEIFSWWNVAIKEEQLGSVVSTPLKFANENSTPAMAEKALGDGRIVAFTIPADGDWSFWAAHPTYICVMWDLVNYLVGKLADEEKIQVGGSLVETVDLSRYDLQVALTDPKEEKIEATAQPIDQTQESQGSILHQVRFEELDQRGFYRMDLKLNNQETDPVLFAANVDPNEGNLERLDIQSLDPDFFGEDVRLISGEELALKHETGSSTEMWIWVLLILGGVLGLEQFLGYWFGRRR